MPASLEEVESGAEDTIDHAHRGDRARVVATAESLRRAASGRAVADLREAGVTAARIALLQDRARRVDALAPDGDVDQVSLAANQVSALMPELFARFKDPVPPGVLKLDYLDREAQLRSRAGDLAAVGPAVRTLSSTWTSLRPDVIAAGGAGVAARYDRHVASMRRLARDPGGQALQREAVTGLELVDALETAFRRAQRAD